MRDVKPRSFNKIVFVEKPARTADATTNEVKQGFVQLCRRAASIDPTGGREIMNAHGVEADSSHTIRMFFDSTTAQIDPSYRLRVDIPQRLQTPGGPTSRYFNVLNCNDVQERNRLLVLMCKEQTV